MYHQCQDPSVSKEGVVEFKNKLTKNKQNTHLSQSTFCKVQTICSQQRSQLTDNLKKVFFFPQHYTNYVMCTCSSVGYILMHACIFHNYTLFIWVGCLC